MNTENRPANIPRKHWKVLWALWRLGRATPREIVAINPGLATSDVQSTLTNLEVKGMVAAHLVDGPLPRGGQRYIYSALVDKIDLCKQAVEQLIELCFENEPRALASFLRKHYPPGKKRQAAAARRKTTRRGK